MAYNTATTKTFPATKSPTTSGARYHFCYCFVGGKRGFITTCICLICAVGFLVDLQRIVQSHALVPDYSTPVARAVDTVKSKFILRNYDHGHPSYDGPASLDESQPLGSSTTHITGVAQDTTHDQHLPFVQHALGDDAIAPNEITNAQTSKIELLSPRNDSNHVGDTLLTSVAHVGNTTHDPPRNPVLAEHLPFAQHAIGDDAIITSYETTNAQNSTIELLSPRNDSIHVGDTLHFVITAKDSKGMRRTVGGDFWFAALRNPDLRAGTSARIVDHDNGTYSMFFIAGWKGDAMLEVTLVHPSEAVHWLKTLYKYGDHMPKWDGIFRRGKTTEHRKCYVLYDSVWKNMCEYHPKRALKHTKFVCERPKNKKVLPCETLTGIYGESNFPAEFNRLLPANKKVLFDGRHLYKQLQVSLGFIHIMDRPSDEQTSADDTATSPRQRTDDMLPPCGGDLPISMSDGYWLRDQWHSLTCRANNSFTREEAMQCLKHTNVIFTGDSTTRQWFASLAELLGFGHPEDHERTFILERNIPQPDINISFAFHPLSNHNKPVFVNFSQVRFEVDILLDIPAKSVPAAGGKMTSSCDSKHVVVISPWAHFLMWPWDAYMEWLTNIRDVMLEVVQKCPNLKLVVKSPHAVDRVTTKKGRDYLFTEMKRAMRDVFQGTGAIFIDIWDMDYAYPSPMVLHMPKEVIDQEIALFLSYICTPSSS